MKKQNEDITLEPRNRNDLLDDTKKIAGIHLTKEEKLVLVKGIDGPLWDVIMKIWRKQRAMQIAAACINTAADEKDLAGWQGRLKENDQMEKQLRKIVDDFNKEEESKKSGNKTNGAQPSPAGAREMISKVK